MVASRYDRARGVLRVGTDALGRALAALEAIGCREDELSVTRSVRTATIRIGSDGRTDRGVVWAFLFAAAVHRAGHRA